jgi:hypothetical protein
MATDTWARSANSRCRQLSSANLVSIALATAAQSWCTYSSALRP